MIQKKVSELIEYVSLTFRGVIFLAMPCELFYFSLCELTPYISAFAFGSVALDGLQIASYFESPATTDCKSDVFILVYVMHLLFTFVQTFFLFKNHKVIWVWTIKPLLICQKSPSCLSLYHVNEYDLKLSILFNRVWPITLLFIQAWPIMLHKGPYPGYR